MWWVGVLILPQLWDGCHHGRGDLSIVTIAQMSPARFPLRLEQVAGDFIVS